MLDPYPITNKLAAALLAIPALSSAVHGRITAYHYILGVEDTLIQTVYKMPAPSILVAWEGTKGGKFDGATLFKHRFGVYYRMANMAGVASPVGYEALWRITCHNIPTGQTVNLRYMSLDPGLDIMDTPSVEHMLDEDQVDLFKATLVWPEIGDQ